MGAPADGGSSGVVYGALAFENDQTLVYEVRADPRSDLESTLVISRDDPDDWQFFGEPSARIRACAVYSKARRVAGAGGWPATVVFASCGI